MFPYGGSNPAIPMTTRNRVTVSGTLRCTRSRGSHCSQRKCGDCVWKWSRASGGERLITEGRRERSQQIERYIDDLWEEASHPHQPTSCATGNNRTRCKSWAFGHIRQCYRERKKTRCMSWAWDTLDSAARNKKTSCMSWALDTLDSATRNNRTRCKSWALDSATGNNRTRCKSWALDSATGNNRTRCKSSALDSIRQRYREQQDQV